MAVQKTQSPLLYSYLKKYQQDPTSRVFAPLAEAYRKAGLVDEAIDIAREGLQHHPHFVGGKVALARALFDKKKYTEVIEELSPIIQDVPDNLVAQKLIAESYLMLGRVVEALSSYKMLLYFNPLDQEAAQMVWELEAQAYAKGVLVLRTDSPAAHSETPFGSVQDRSHWIQKVELLQSLLQRVERYRRASI